MNQVLSSCLKFYRHKATSRTAICHFSCLTIVNLLQLSCSKALDASGSSQKLPKGTFLLPHTTVLMYHNVIAENPGNLNSPIDVSLANFKQQMNLLACYQVPTRFADQPFTGTAGNPAHPGSRSAIITFDDGYISQSDLAWPILKELRLRASFFVITGWAGKKKYVGWDTWRDFEKTGFAKVFAHTVTHPHLSELAYDDIYTELSQSKAKVESEMGGRRTALAYPHGEYNTDVVLAAKKLGYKIGYSVSDKNVLDSGAPSEDNQFFGINRFNVTNKVTLEAFKKAMGLPLTDSSCIE
jgi:peptidoglycan/xylan/chitin deacetylase (PgdA/CDA1 family)